MKTYDNRRSPETGFLPLFGWRRDSARRPLRQTGHSSGETCPPGGLQEVTRVLVESNGRPNNPLASAPHIDDICARCGGLLVLEHYMVLQDDTGQIGMTALRCTSCGEVIDPVILQNRVRSGPESLVRYEAAQSRWKATVARDMATDQAAVSLCGL